MISSHFRNPLGTRTSVPPQALSRMGALVEEIASLTAAGKQVMLISSGAVGLGRERVGLSKEVVANVKNVVERQVHITYKT